jgi:hypothetical protein
VINKVSFSPKLVIKKQKNSRNHQKIGTLIPVFGLRRKTKNIAILSIEKRTSFKILL